MASSNNAHIAEGLDGSARIAGALVTPFLQSKRARWGATDYEVRRALPGDDIVAASTGGYTHAVTIHAAASEIWPWLVQIGQGRGGFYSYELLENLAGCQIRNADQILPEFQHLEVGDSVAMHPSNGVPYTVVAVEPNKALVLRLCVDLKSGEAFDPAGGLPDEYHMGSWAFCLQGLDVRLTRLISRSRNAMSVNAGNKIFYAFIGRVSVIMDRRMLIGIKKRAEADVKTG